MTYQLYYSATSFAKLLLFGRGQKPLLRRLPKEVFGGRFVNNGWEYIVGVVLCTIYFEGYGLLEDQNKNSICKGDIKEGGEERGSLWIKDIGIVNFSCISCFPAGIAILVAELFQPSAAVGRKSFEEEQM
eukprot:scaffold24250_cov61-Attheya_sp.AAC.7